MLGLLFFLAGAAAIALLVWNYRRKTQQREALSKARFEEMFRNEARAGAPSPVTRMPAAAAPKPSAVGLGRPAAAPRMPFLSQPETLVYYLLRTGIPDHAVFAKVPLSLAIGGSAGRSGRAAECLLDFVVCDKNMRVAAVVEIGGAGKLDTAGSGVSNADKVDRLNAAGVRIASIDVSALPSRGEIRKRVLGESTPVA